MLTNLTNLAILIGRIGNISEIRKTKSDVEVVNFSLATSVSYKDKDGNFQEKTTWHRCTIWGSNAKFFTDYRKKGDLIMVIGNIQNKPVGEGKDKRYETSIRVERQQMIQSANSNNAKGSNKGANKPADVDSSFNSNIDEKGTDLPDDDIPF